MPRPPGQHGNKGLERTWIGSGSYARGALVRRGERAGAPAPPPGRRIWPEETAPITPYYARRPWETWGQTRQEGRGHETPEGLGTRGGRTWGAKQWWQPPRGAERARDKVGINKEKENGGGTVEPRRGGVSRCRIGRSDGPAHFASRGWKQKEPLEGGPVDGSEWTRPEVGQAEEHGWRHQRMEWYYIGWRGAHGDQFNRASRTNCQPA